MHKKLYKIATLGCRTNQYEAEAFRTQLEGMGYQEVGEGEEAEISIVNTCTVTASADKKSRLQIAHLAAQNPAGRLFVTGCLAEREGKSLSDIPGVTKVVSNKDKEHLLEIAFPELSELPEFSIKQFQAHTRAFVKVQDGCNSYCSYCVIPFVRGRSRSKTIAGVLSEIRELVQNGYKEIVLTGINIGDFADGEKRLCDLVKEVDKIEGVERLRLSSIDPDEVDDALIEAIVGGRNTCPSMHIVLQAGSNSVLKRMNRKYTKQEFFHSLERLKAAHQDFTFTTDVIVGFPGESEADFSETLEVIREVRFAKVHMFPYSVRPKTRAERFPDKVPEEVIRERKERVLRLAEQAAFALRQEYVGKRRKVLLEEAHFGHTENFLEVEVKGKPLERNQIVEVVCLENSARGLIGCVT